MGLDIHAVTFLLEAVSHGVSFEDCAMLGRQGLAVDAPQMKAAFARAGLTIDDPNVRRLFENPEGGTAGYGETLLRHCGAARITSIDYSGFEGATLIHDLNTSIADALVSRFSCVIDSGTLEHVFNVPVALTNCMRMVKTGGHLLAIVPCNNLAGHGFYQFSPELFWSLLSEPHGFVVERMFVSETRPRARWYAVANPAVVQARVTLRNHRETILLVQARKVRQEDLRTLAVQQSDYVEAWRRGALPADRATPAGGRLGSALAHVLPERFKRVLRPLVFSAADRLRGPYREPFYRKYR